MSPEDPMSGDEASSAGAAESAPFVIPSIGGPIDASVAVPGSKSIANRALVCAALACGVSEIGNLPDGDDVTAMLAALTALGAGVTLDGPAANPTQRVRIDGWGGPPTQSATVNAGLAGTTSRFLVAVAALGQQPITIDGAEPLRQRPFAALFDALDQLGVKIGFQGRSGHLPATLTGPPSGDRVRLPGDVSSQFISALMMIAPLLDAGLALEIETELVSRPYVELTADVMGRFGAETTIADQQIHVAAAGYRAADIEVEPDASSASYPFAIAAVVGGRITVPGLGRDSQQGDVQFAAVLSEMGCDVTVEAEHITVERPTQRRLRGVDIDMADISDLVPTVAAVAAFAETPTTIRGVGFIRGKESDRLGDLARELGKLGVEISETADGVRIEPSSNQLHGGSVDTHHDHRLAMAAGVVAAGVDGVTVDDPGVVAKSWPGYWQARDAIAETARNLGA